MSQLDSALAAFAEIAALRRADLNFEVRRLRAWRELTLQNLPIKEGDRAAIGSLFPSIPTTSGWYAWRECLCTGQTGVVTEIDISPDTLTISGLFKPDIQWSVSDGGSGILRTPASDRSFYIAVRYLEPVVPDQAPIPMPEDGDADAR